MAETPQDLTRPEWIANASAKDRGTGIYWTKDTAGNYEQMFVPLITFQQFQFIAENLNFLSITSRLVLDATRWVPERIEDAASLVRSECSGRCNDDLDCVNNACRCIGGLCRRK